SVVSAGPDSGPRRQHQHRHRLGWCSGWPRLTRHEIFSTYDLPDQLSGTLKIGSVQIGMDTPGPIDALRGFKERVNEGASIVFVKPLERGGLAAIRRRCRL